VTQLLQWTAMQINRRTFLRRTLGGAFAAYAGTAIGAPSAFAASCPYPCTGPHSSNRCTTYVPGTCSGASCANVYGVTCDFVTGFCIDSSACWSVSGHTCCDCHCGDFEGDTWYCFCSS